LELFAVVSGIRRRMQGFYIIDVYYLLVLFLEIEDERFDESFESHETQALTGSIEHIRFVTFFRVTRSISIPLCRCCGTRTTSSSSSRLTGADRSDNDRLRSPGEEFDLR
jgi:hypothetical protein